MGHQEPPAERSGVANPGELAAEAVTSSATRGRILVVVTHPVTADVLMRGQLRDLADHGWQIGVASSGGARLHAVSQREGCGVFPVPMRREISPLADIRALLGLVRVMRRFAPDLVSAGTPKAGLLGILAAVLAGVPRRVYVVRGLRLETLRGWRRAALAAAERVSARLATTIVTVSPSLRERYVQLRLARRDRLVVLGSGSSNGVDTRRFVPGPVASEPEQGELMPFRSEDQVIGFVGRLTRDKGVSDLLDAFDAVRAHRPPAALLLVGDFESGDPLSAGTRQRIVRDARIHVTGFVPDTAPYYRHLCVLAFPSAREGFPNAPLEAAATGVPTVGYRVTGTRDAILNGRTGALVDAGDVEALAAALERYLDDPALAREHGRAARARVEADFQCERVWRRWSDLYASLMS